jgi:tRNA(fMet)-specific endonuclease VapC
VTLLDTDHFSALQFAESDRAVALANRLDRTSPGEACISVVTVKEQLRGWLAAIHGCKTDAAQVPLYTRLAVLVKVFADWRIVDFDGEAAALLSNLRKQKLRLGTMDLKIAAICLAA